jgi:hypothetical protein
MEAETFMRRITCASIVALTLIVYSSTPVFAQSLTLELLGRYTTGLANIESEVTSAETVALSKNRMYVTNATDVSLDIVDLTDPATPKLHKRVDLSAYGSSANSVDISSNNLIAVAVAAHDRTDPGTVVFLTPGGEVVRTATVGANPDMVVFTRDGRRLLVANEGEPECYNSAECVDPEGSVSVIDVIPVKSTPVVHTIDFQSVTIPAGVRIFGPGASPAQDLEPEYIAVSEDGSTAWVTLQENNAIARLDLDNLSVTDIFPLGYKNHALAGNGLDASDQDGGINIANWNNVLGMYQPDAIAHFKLNGGSYLITANEGDARDWAGFAEEIRVRAQSGNVISNATFGRLTVTRSRPNGDTNNYYAFGARSFSIWNADDGSMLWDSGDDLEQRVAAKLPAFFNSNNTGNDFDTRSDNKGPEPEAIAVGRVGGQTYAFIGLERVGGIIVYNISIPNLPVFEDYFVTRDFSADPFGPDSGPEVIRFIPADESPTKKPILAVGNEITGSAILISLTPNF